MSDERTPLMILIAGPYRSGTGDDPAKIAANVAAMASLPGALLTTPGARRRQWDTLSD